MNTNTIVYREKQTVAKTLNKQIKSIDGIRGISILMVLFAHATSSLPNSVTKHFIYRIVANGHTGVMIFFVISGYLITKLLLVEKEKNGNISIKDFYIRRLLRIFPIFYLYIGIVVLLKVTIFPTIFSSYTTIFFSAVYLWNYKHLLTSPSYSEGNGNMFMGHFWSLSMEEQFYLIWPFIFKKLSIKSLKNFVVIAIIAMPILRLATYFFFPSSRGQIGMMLHTGGDTIFVGCLGAILEASSPRFTIRLKELFSKTWLVIVAFIYLLVVDPYLVEKFRGAYTLPIGHSISNFIILFLLFWCIHVPSIVHRFLNLKWIKQIGVISYSIYIWQQLFFSGVYQSVFNSFPVNFIVVFIIAFVSYYLIEKPILKLKYRFKKGN